MEEHAEHPMPGGTFRDALEWQISLSKEPPYRQVINLMATWTLIRPGRPDVRFVYRVQTDSTGPRPSVTLTEGQTP